MELGHVGVIKLVQRYCSEVHLYLCIRLLTGSNLFCQGILQKNETQFFICQTGSGKGFSLSCELCLDMWHPFLFSSNLLAFRNFKIVGLILDTWVKCDFVNAWLSLAHDSRLIILHLWIQATGKQDWCESVALLLHYLHLVACCWLFSVAVLAYRSLTEGPRPSGLRFHCTLAWFLPATLVLVSNWILAGTV